MMGTVVSNHTTEGATNKEDMKEVQDEREDTGENDIVKEDTDDAKEDTGINNAAVFDRQSSFVENWRTKWVEAYKVIVGSNKPGQYSVVE